MRLLRFGSPGEEKPGILDDAGVIRDISSVVDKIDGTLLSSPSFERLADLSLKKFPSVDRNIRVGACIGGVGNFICIGLNYLDHAEETHSKIPTQPVLFTKHTAAVSGPFDPIVCPPGAQKLDWEVELAAVVGRECWHVSESEALQYIAGYCTANDVSERAYQSEMEGQWSKGKSYFSFGPIGPWLVTRNEVTDPQNLDLSLDVNGVRRQTGHTSKMIFSVAHIVAYLSRFMRLQPGDVISTGTPAGIGARRNPPVFLSPGDSVRLDVSGLGEQRQQVVHFDEYMRGYRGVDQYAK